MPGLLVQKILPGLCIGQRLTVAKTGSPIHSMQGSFDGGCAIHSAAMALSILGLMPEPARVTHRPRGNARSFWSQLRAHYLDGIALADLETVLLSLDLGVRTKLMHGSHAIVTSFVEAELMRKRPVIISWSPLRSTYLHAVLAIGLEGRATGATFSAETILALDPYEYEPSLSAANARVTYTGSEARNHRHYATYTTRDTSSKVVIEGALSLRVD